MIKLSPSLSSLLGAADVRGSLFNPNKAKNNKQQRYLHLMRGVNVHSFSTGENLQSCERKYSRKKLELNNDFQSGIETVRSNIHFAFGRAIETGIQSTFLGKSKARIFWDMFNAWDLIPLTIEDVKANKSFALACIAIDQFQYIKNNIFAGWEIAMFNGKPAVELAMCIDLENGYYYVGHADIILWHPVLRRYKVLEIKTTGNKTLHEAMYKNSSQATGYSIFVDSIAKDAEASATFEVYYLVFPTAIGHWNLYEFTKSRSARAEWINTLLFDIQRINLSRQTGIWPKRGSACFDWYRPCEYFDRCDLDASSFNPTGEFAVIGEEEINQHDFDFKFKLSEVLELQKELI